MKKLIAISFLTVYLFSTTELYQLVKLPCLVEHFIEHKQQNTKITLWDFLCMHYAQGDVKDADYAKDMKLPFKTHDGCTNSSVSAFSPNNFSTDIIRPVFNELRSFPSYQEVFTASSFLSNIWQPPKSC